MAWNTIAIGDVTDELSPQEVTAFNTLQGQSTTQGNILTRVVGEVRGFVRGGGNQLDAEGTVPDQLRNVVIDICLWRWLKKFPQLKALQTEVRKDAYTEAMAMLKEIAKKDSSIRVELPAAATAESGAAPVNQIRQVSGEARQMTRRQTNGL